MCGIAGIFLRRGAVDEGRLRAMQQALRHRGPDGEGLHLVPPPEGGAGGGVGLAHTRLAVIDPEGGRQPFVDAADDLALVANGEIYNHLELRRELEAAGRPFATGSDCEAVLHAYARWGDRRFLERLEGMFAFALWDGRRRRLLLVRDRLGIKPLYYLQRPEGVYFASEPKAILRALDRRPEVDPWGLGAFLQANHALGERTLLRGLRRVLPGELLLLEEGRVLERRRWWQLWDLQPARWSQEEAVARFEALLEEVIPRHLRADVPWGLFLSGGVDSSLLLALLTHYGGRPVHTFSIAFEAPGAADERPAAEAAARRFGALHTQRLVGREELLERLPHAVWAADEPLADYACLPASLLAELAGRELKVAFSGEGGDEVFAGYGRYRVPRPLRLLRALRHPGTGGYRTRGNFRGLWAQRVFGLALQQGAFGWREPYRLAWEELPKPWSDLARMQHVDLRTWLPEDLLVKADRMLMAWGVEGRVPFLDHRIVAFGLRLPDRLKVNGRTGKVFLRRWGRRWYPDGELERPKQGFTVPVRQWLSGTLLERLGELLPRQRAIREWCQPEGVRALVARQARRGDAAAPLWALLHFALWHRLFVEGDGSPPPPRQDPLELLAA